MSRNPERYHAATIDHGPHIPAIRRENLPRQIPLSEKSALQIRRGAGRPRPAELHHLRRQRVPAPLTREARLQRRADARQPRELAVGVVEVGGRVGGEDGGEEGEVVRVDGGAEGVEGVLDVRGREAGGPLVARLRGGWG